jgi:hypothetical protein
MRIGKSVRLKKSAHAKKSGRFTGAIGTRAIVLVVIGVIGAAMLIAARQSSETPDLTRIDVKPAPAATPGQPRRTAAAKGPAVEAVVTNTLPADATAVNAPAGTSTAKAVQKPAPVTITGCLQRDDKTFRLKDTLGEDAPKSRSWKSGFLKKSPAPIEVVDASDSLGLRNHVGQRVSVTGVIVDREMQARSLQRVAASCNASVKTLEH